MTTPITLDDFPTNEANCATCTRTAGECARSKANKHFPNGMCKGINGETAGIIYRCQHYMGRY